MLYVIYLCLLGFSYAKGSAKERLHCHLSTKTPYWLSLVLDGLDTDNYFGSQNSTTPFPCSYNNSAVIYVTAVFRHGTRFPGKKDLGNARNILSKLSDAFLSHDILASLHQVLYSLDAEDKAIAPAGITELRKLGQQFGLKYSEFFGRSGSKAIEYFVTKKSRTIKSFEGFLNGFQEVTGYKFNATATTRDDLLRFYDHCEKYLINVDKNKSAIIEAELYFKSMQSELNKYIQSVTNTTNLNLSLGELDSLLGIAGCELSILNSTNWLSLISEEALDILNYASDIADFWKKGPGYKINYKQCCVLISEIFKAFDGIISGDKSNKGAFYFAHAETLFPLFAALELLNDSLPLNHDNHELNINRTFKGSRISPFASNIQFVLHQCQNESEKQIFIEMLLKGHPVNWPFCGNSMCLYEKVRYHYSEYIDNCNFEDICKMDQQYLKKIEL